MNTSTTMTETKTLSRTDALFAKWVIEKNEITTAGWKWLRDALDLPIGTPKAQIRSTLETYIQNLKSEDDTMSRSGKDHWTYEASLNGDWDESHQDEYGKYTYFLFLPQDPDHTGPSFITHESEDGFWLVWEYAKVEKAWDDWSQLKEQLNMWKDEINEEV